MGSTSFGVLVIDATGGSRRRELIDELERQVGSALRDAGENLVTPDAPDHTQLDGCAASVAVVFCAGAELDYNSEVIAACISKNRVIFPVVNDLSRFRDLVPKELGAYNGFELPESEDVGELVTFVLENLGLVRAKRRVFISYARCESRAIAIQLHDALVRRWYSVFLDTHSIRPGETFQEQLKASLTDCDMMVLLRTSEIEERKFVMEEIEFADQANLGVLQIIWPECQPLSEAGFFQRCRLSDQDFQNRQADKPEQKLSEDGVKKVLTALGSQRVAAQVHRERQLVERLRRRAAHMNATTTIHKGRFVRVTKDKKSIRVDTALGYPDSRRLQEAMEAIEDGAQPVASPNLLYDPLGMTDSMADHLRFLGNHLGVTLVPKLDSETLVPK